jgi:cytochrome bd-type quinol oxidase subunit 2
MASHLVALVVFSALVAVVFALLQRQQKRERIRFGVMAFGAFVLSALVVGWLMFPFPS